jgi:F0F1-type ATP synthase delta subunit
MSTEGVSTETIIKGLNFFINKHKLDYLLPSLVDHLERLQNESERLNTLNIKIGLPIEQETVEEIKKAMKLEDKVKVKTEIDSDLIGGFIATHQSLIYDASLKNQLNLLKARLIEK